MSNGSVVRLIAACVVAAAAGTAFQAAQPAENGKAAGDELARLGWLTGSWVMEQGGRRVEEHWTEPRAGAMFGISRTIAGDRTREFEFLRIARTEDGIAYLAQPGGRHPPTAFKLIESGDQRAVFENPDHDFPKRLEYARVGDELSAIVSGDGDQKLEFRWRKAEAPAMVP